MRDFGIINYPLNSGDSLQVIGDLGFVFFRVKPIFLFGYLNLTVDGRATIPLNHSDRLFFVRRTLLFHYFSAHAPCDVTVWFIPTYCSSQGYSYHSSHQRSAAIDFQNITSPVPICYMFEFQGNVTCDLHLIHGDQAYLTLMEQVGTHWDHRTVALQPQLTLNLANRFVIDVPLSLDVAFTLKIRPNRAGFAADWADPGGQFRPCKVMPDTSRVECGVPPEFNFRVTEDREMPGGVITCASVVGGVAIVACLVISFWDELFGRLLTSRMQPLAAVPSIAFT
jgi:hypothetical protein